MGVNSSWYSEQKSGAGGHKVPWHETVTIAQRMSDPEDEEYGRYKKTREASGVEQKYRNFKDLVDFGAHISSDGNSSYLEDLKESVQAFRKAKHQADMASKVLDSLLKDLI